MVVILLVFKHGKSKIHETYLLSYVYSFTKCLLRNPGNIFCNDASIGSTVTISFGDFTVSGDGIVSDMIPSYFITPRDTG